MADLIAAEEDGDRLSETELIQNCIFLLNAGHETTTNLVGNGVNALLDFPGELSRLVDDPTLIESAIEEIAVDVGRPPGVGAHHRERAEAARARHAELDLAQLGHQPTAIRAVAPVGRTALGHLDEMTVDPGRHAALENVLQRRPTGLPVVLAPLDPLRLHGLHHPKRTR